MGQGVHSLRSVRAILDTHYCPVMVAISASVHPQAESPSIHYRDGQHRRNCSRCLQFGSWGNANLWTDLMRKKPLDPSGRPRNYGRPSLSTRFETVRYLNGINSSPCPGRAVPIQAIADALVAAGYTSLDKQAKALGLCRSTTWTIMKMRHKLGRLNRQTAQRILENPDTPSSVRAIVQKALGPEEHVVGAAT